MQIIRVFPVKTSYTPDDEFCFFDTPPFRELIPDHDEIHVCCVFTWDRQRADLEEQREVLLLEVAQKDQIINELQPKATYYDLILQNKSLLPITVIAKDYGKSGDWMNKKLHEMNVQFKQGKVWLLYQKYAEKGYTQSRTINVDAEKSVFHTYWTQKGRIFIYELLKDQGILPLIEVEKQKEA